jgi:hypothetical protein
LPLLGPSRFFKGPDSALFQLHLPPVLGFLALLLS